MLDLVKKILESDQLIVYPTSTLPGLGCLPTKEGLDALFEIKQREKSKPVSLGVYELSQASDIVEIPVFAQDFLNSFPKGSITMVLPALQPMDERLGGEKVAIRVFAHPTASSIAKEYGPITATSANKAGETPLNNTLSAAKSLGLSEENVIVGDCPGGHGSTLVNLEKTHFEDSGWSLSIMREGVVPREDVVGCWKTRV